MKETFYFPHDCNAIQDPKMMRLLSSCGVAGVGLFWIIIEIMHQQDNGNPLGGHWGAIGGEDLSHYISFYGKQGAWNDTTLKTFLEVVFDTKLLIRDKGVVYSERVENNYRKRVELKNKGKENASRRWQPNGVPMATQCDPNAIKESKVKESKVKITTKEVVALKGGATSPQGDFVLNFGKTYEAMTAQPFKAAKEDFVIVARLIRDHGYEAVVLKAEMLGRLCDVRTSWFTKAGWADYTVKNLSRNWNSILESSNQSPDKEFAEEMKRQEERNARINDAINR